MIRQRSMEKRNISKLEKGDYIVHNIYGLGRYLGIKTLEKDNIKKDYLMVEYSGGDKLYIPVEKIDNIYKYASIYLVIVKINIKSFQFFFCISKQIWNFYFFYIILKTIAKAKYPNIIIF